MSESLDRDSWILHLREGDMFEIEGLLPGLDPQEPVVWQVLEVANVSEVGNPEKMSLLSAHAYYHDVFIARGQVKISVGEVPNWSIK